MTEVVTSFAASQQLNLTASRLQGFGVSTVVQQPTAPTAEANALQSALAASDKAEDKSFASELPGRDASAGNSSSGPSRPRIEIKQFDVGLSAAEVVGTQDVLQRFDANGDGRVDLLESDKAALVRQKVFTFAGLAAAPSKVSVEQTHVDLSEAEAPALARETGAAIAALASFDEAGVPKKFSASLVQDPGAKKFFADAATAEGTPSGVVDAPKKYYGQGAEVVAGPVANGNNNGAPVKYSDRAPVREQSAVSEEGTGEVKYYDRVPQAEAGENGDDTTSREKYSEKAQEIAAAYAALQGDPAPVEAPIVTIVTA
jgi:hypothetical protein